jgi:RNA 2',3'-cyclic 3'-phosphodiesterase
VRLFLAINFPSGLRHAVIEATTPLRAVAPALGWIGEPNLHLTVKFLGEQSPDAASQVSTAMHDVARRHRGVGVELRGVGAFPNFRRPRVVWMGVSPEPKLELLHHDVESAAAKLGFEMDGRPFRPHLTLARVKPRSTDVETLRALARAAKDIEFAEELFVESIDLMQSDLSSAGARYRVLASAPLGHA